MVSGSFVTSQESLCSWEDLNNNSYLMVISGKAFDSRIGLSDDGYGEDICVLDTLDTRDDRKEMDRKM